MGEQSVMRGTGILPESSMNGPCIVCGNAGRLHANSDFIPKFGTGFIYLCKEDEEKRETLCLPV